VKRILKFFPVIIAMIGPIQSAIINVPVDEPTIQAGINAASDGDTVLVDSGIYVENINFNGKNIVVGSLFLTTGDTSYISQTVIDGNEDGSVVTFENGENLTSVLTGFIIKNGSSILGGGIYCENSNPTLINVTITGNLVTGPYGLGGGIYCENSSPALINVTVNENTSGDGGSGIYCSSSSPSLTNVTISGNSATSPYVTGGGIYCVSNSSPSLVNVTISSNTAYVGGGIYCASNSSPSLVNTILWNNFPEEIYLRSSVDLNTITVTYSNVQGGEEGIVTNDNGTAYWLEGNIDNDPLFIDAENGNFHLRQGSPCIDAGTVFIVWEGDTLVNFSNNEYNGTAPDMGAFESPYSVGINELQVLPTKFGLYPNYPNPFNPVTTISYELPELSLVNLSVYNILGQVVQTLVNEMVEAGYHSITWNASGFNSGVYIYKIKMGQYSESGKCLLLK